MDPVFLHFDDKLFWPPMKWESFYIDSPESERFRAEGRVIIPTRTKRGEAYKKDKVDSQENES